MAGKKTRRARKLAGRFWRRGKVIVRWSWRVLKYVVLRYGCALLVALGAAAAAYLAIKVAVPHPLPSFALRAKSVYRIEVGGAAFIAFYVIALFLVLALHGEGPRQLGTGGFQTGQIVRQATRQQQKAIRDQDQSVRAAGTGIRKLQLGLRAVSRALKTQERALVGQEQVSRSIRHEMKELSETVTDQERRIATLESDLARIRPNGLAAAQEIENPDDDEAKHS